MECNIVKENAKFAKSEKERQLSAKITVYVRYSYLKNPRISVKIRGHSAAMSRPEVGEHFSP